jgi:hypothetical protein
LAPISKRFFLQVRICRFLYEYGVAGELGYKRYHFVVEEFFSGIPNIVFDGAGAKCDTLDAI